jgi:hypothetical protein
MTIPATDDRLLRRPRCFILQEPKRKDRDTGQMVSVMNFGRVSEFGDPVVCFTHHQVSLIPHPTKERLKDLLRDFTDEDYIVAVGDPTLIFLAGMVVSDLNRGCCKMLKYDKEARSYTKIQFDIFQRLGETR